MNASHKWNFRKVSSGHSKLWHGATTDDLIRRLVEAHVASSEPAVERRFDVPLPLIPAAETGPIQPVTGGDVDELFSRDHFAA